MVKALEGLSGVKKAVASFPEKMALIHYDPDSVTLDQMKEALLKTGYVVSLADNRKQNQNIFKTPGREKGDLRKDDLVCFCFEYTREDIEQDYLTNGYSTIVEKIAAEKKAGRCDCATKNPKGR